MLMTHGIARHANNAQTTHLFRAAGTTRFAHELR
jgi:hypothetical protein